MAVCPFPGKYPLRLFCEVYMYDVLGKATLLFRYSGKLTGVAWRGFCRKIASFKKTPGTELTTQWLIFDKNLVVAHGSRGAFYRDCVNTHRFPLWKRYFKSPLESADPLGKLIPVRVGKYWIYSVDGQAFDEASARLRILDIEAQVPEIRRAF
jgi:hypothetical protein